MERNFSIIDYSEKSEEWFQQQSCWNLFYSKPWLNTLARSYQFKPKLILSTTNQLVTIFCEQENILGKRIISLPFSDVCPSAKANGSASENLNSIFEYLSKEFEDHSIILKTDLPPQANIKAEITRNAVYHSIPILHEDPFQNTSKSFTRGVKKAKNNGVSIHLSYSLESLKTFYILYHHIRFQKFNSIPQPFPFFESLWKEFIEQKNGFILEATHSDTVIASLIILNYRNTYYYKFGAAHQDFLDLRPNNLLFSKLLELSVENKITAIDLGLSGTSENYQGLRRWKASIGGIEHPITYWEKITTPQRKQRTEILSKIGNITSAIIKADLDPWKTSILSEQLYPLFA